MIKYIKKRDGKLQEFIPNKIQEALLKAFNSCGYTKLPTYINYIVDALESTYDSESNDNIIEIEKLQDFIESFLATNGNMDVAKSYIIYREKKRTVRDILKERLNYIDKQFVGEKGSVASASETDPNANVGLKNVATQEAESYKSINREIQRARMKNKLNEMFPDVANQYEKDLNSHIIYTHNEASTPVLKNYCEAVSLYPLVLKGCGNMDGTTPEPPHNYHSFCGQLVNLTHSLAGQCKGAVAFGELFNFIDCYCAKDFGDDYHKVANSLDASVRPHRTIKEAIHQGYQQLVCGWNQPAGNRGGQSPFVNISYYDENYWHALFDDFYFPDGSQPVWERVNWLQRDFMEWFNNERLKSLYTFPVESVSLLTKNGDVIDQDYKDWVAEMWAKGHSFFLYLNDNPNALASCCRLSNEILENTFSFTNGLSGVMTGSVNVITLNINRIIQNYFKEFIPKEGQNLNVFRACWKEVKCKESFKNYLLSILNRVYKYHIAYKTMLYEIESKGLLTASNAGYIKMNKLFSTIGINGINEAAEFLGLQCNYNQDYKDFCNLITSTIKEENKEKSTPLFRFNLEFVPAEGLSSKNYKWDKEDNYIVPENRNLYNSYFFIPSDSTLSPIDKLRMHGREFSANCDGGIGCHINLSEHLSKTQYLKLIDLAIEFGTTYFTFNVPNSECTNKDCHHITKIPLTKCPKCGAPMRQWTRVIGFLRPIDNFDAERYKEAQTRFYNDKNSV